MSAERNSAGSRFLRWWMILVCLVASLVCWWGVNTWLEPKPVWSITLPDRKYVPVCEDPSEHLLVVAENQGHDAEKSTRTALVILDSRSGEVLYRTESLDPTMSGDFHTLYHSRIRQHEIWCLTSSDENGVVIRRLHRWKYKQDAKAQVVHTWKNEVTWPETSNILLVRVRLPVEIYCCTPFYNPLYAALVKSLVNQTWLSVPAYDESWKLPEGEGGALEFLARWPLPPSRWSIEVQMSNDGQWAAYPERGGNSRKAAQRARVTGRTSFQGDDLLKLFRNDSLGLLIYSTSTGQLMYQLQNETVSNLFKGWSDDAFVLQSYKVKPEIVLSLEDIETDASNHQLNLYDKSFFETENVYRLTPQGIRMLHWPKRTQRDGETFCFDHGKILEGTYGTDVKTLVHLIDHQDDQLMAANSIEVPLLNHGFYHTWLGNGCQIAIWKPGEEYLWLNNCIGKYKWLDSLVFKIRANLVSRTEVVIIENDQGQQRKFTFHQEPCNLTALNFSQLYLKDEQRQKNQISSVTLNAYALPILWYSPWWSWAAACLPFLLLIACVMQRKRA